MFAILSVIFGYMFNNVRGHSGLFNFVGVFLGIVLLFGIVGLIKAASLLKRIERRPRCTQIVGDEWFFKPMKFRFAFIWILISAVTMEQFILCIFNVMNIMNINDIYDFLQIAYRVATVLFYFSQTMVITLIVIKKRLPLKQKLFELAIFVVIFANSIAWMILVINEYTDMCDIFHETRKNGTGVALDEFCRTIDEYSLATTLRVLGFVHSDLTLLLSSTLIILMDYFDTLKSPAPAVRMQQNGPSQSSGYKRRQYMMRLSFYITSALSIFVVFYNESEDVYLVLLSILAFLSLFTIICGFHIINRMRENSQRHFSLSDFIFLAGTFAHVVFCVLGIIGFFGINPVTDKFALCKYVVYIIQIFMQSIFLPLIKSTINSKRIRDNNTECDVISLRYIVKTNCILNCSIWIMDVIYLDLTPLIHGVILGTSNWLFIKQFILPLLRYYRFQSCVEFYGVIVKLNYVRN